MEDAPAWKAMRVAAGFTQDRSTVFYPRDVKPPDSLLRKVFPFLDESIRQYTGSSQKCLAGKDFLELLIFLRVVFLQDTAILIRMVSFFTNNLHRTLTKVTQCGSILCSKIGNASISINGSKKLMIRTMYHVKLFLLARCLH